jgi:type IV secretory pathway ATPase VirB11/archaellum biosynthesis ATPase
MRGKREKTRPAINLRSYSETPVLVDTLTNKENTKNATKNLLRVFEVVYVEHRKRGNFCSLSCSSKRNHTDETKEKISNTVREHFQTPEGIAQAKVNNRRVNAILNNEIPPVTIDEFAVSIPELSPDLSDYNDYNKAEDW